MCFVTMLCAILYEDMSAHDDSRIAEPCNTSSHCGRRLWAQSSVLKPHPHAGYESNLTRIPPLPAHQRGGFAKTSIH